MHKKHVYLVMIFSLLLSLTFCPPIIKTVRATPTEITVEPGGSIQEAINNASDGDIILVKAGTYYEHVFINKSVKLIGENPLNTIIDGNETGIVVHIDSPNVTITGFTIQNGGESTADFGLYLSEGATNVTVLNNVIRNNRYGGLRLLKSKNNNIVNNKIVENFYCGIAIFDNSSHNSIVGNIISNASVFGILFDSSSNNTIYHNNFINNTKHVEWYGTSVNTWDNGAEGNYWSDYAGVDANGDGIGDIGYPDPYFPLDKYPLIEPWGLIRVIDVYQNEEHHYVIIYCNSTVGWRRGNVPFFFNQPERRISFNVTGPSNTMGFCNLTIPKRLINATPPANWQVFLDDYNITDTVNISENATHTSLYFTYIHTTHRIQVIGTEAIPNLPPIADFTYMPLYPTVQDFINFTDASTDPDGTIIRWYWDFGDGNNSTIQNPTHKYDSKGFYAVSLTVTDNVQASNTISKTVVVGKFRTELTLTVPSTATVRETTIVTAFLKDENNMSLPDEIIDFYYYENGEWKSIDSAFTNASGAVSVTYTPAIWGEHQIMVNYTGSARYFENYTTKTLMVNPLIVTLTIDAPDSLTLILGKTITIKATLKDENGAPIPNATIRFYLFKDETWELIDSSETNSDGIAMFEYTPPATGKFYIKAEFPGTQIYGKTSDVITLNVNFDYTHYILVGLVAIAAIALIAFAIWRKRKKTPKI